MARFPVYDRRQGVQGGQTASYANASAFAAPGRALEGLGNTISNVGDQFQAAQDKIQSTQDDVWFSKARAETAMQVSQFDNEARKSATGDAAGYQESVLGQFNTVRQSFLDRAPSDGARVMYEKWANTYQADVWGQTAKFRAESELNHRADTFTQAMLAHTQTVFDNPDQYETVRKRALDDLEGAKQWMTPEQETKARNNIERELQMARSKSAIMRDPREFQKSIGIEAGGPVSGEKAKGISFTPQVDSAISSAASKHGVDEGAMRVVAYLESGGNPSAKNSRSSAGGLFQFIDGTAAQYGVRDRYNPHEAADAGARLMRDNRDGLRRALGREPNTGELYLAHQQGLGGAIKLLSNPTARAADIVGAKAVSLNGGGPNMSALQFANLWITKANKLAGVANAGIHVDPATGAPSFAGNPDFSHLTIDDMIGLYEASQSRINQLEREREAERTASLASMKGAFQLGIATGDANVTPQSILASPLSDADKAQLINSWESENKDRVTAADYASRLAGDGAPLDPYSSEDRKGAGLVYDAARDGGSIYDEDGKARNLAEMIYNHSGIIPEGAANELRGGLVSGDPARVAAAASIADRLAADNPDALSANPNGDELAKAAATYRHLTRRMGMTPEEAGERMVDMRDPEKMKQREALLESEAVKTALKDVTASDIANDLFDAGLFDSQEQLGATPAAESIMVADYKDMLKESIVEAAGDMELAKEYAAQRFKSIYGESTLSLSGPDVITYLPPELTYPAGPDGTHGYIREQLRSELGTEGDVFLQATDETRADHFSGRPPRYAVFYVENGTLKQYPGTFTADQSRAMEFTPSTEINRERFEANRDREMERQSIIDSYGRGPNPLDEMNAAGREASEIEAMAAEQEAIDAPKRDASRRKEAERLDAIVGDIAP